MKEQTYTATQMLSIVFAALVIVTFIAYLSTITDEIKCNNEYLGQCRVINMRNLAEKICMSTNSKFHSYNITNYIVKKVNCVEKE